MILRRVTDFVLRSRYQAILAAFVLAFIPIIGSFSILIAAFVTLRKGVFEGALVLIAATIPNAIEYLTYPPTTGDQVEIQLIALWVAIGSNVLTWGLAVVLRRYASWSFVLEIAALIGIAIVIAVHVFYPDITGWWQTQLTTYLGKTEAALGTAVDADVIASQNEVVAAMKLYATGVIVASVILNALLQLLVARWWQALMFNPTGLRSELYQIRLGYASAVVFIIALALFHWGSASVSDIMPILFLTFCLAGLSLLHYLAVPARYGWFWLLVIYGSILGLFPVGLVCVSFVALLDTVLNIRERFDRTLQ